MLSYIEAKTKARELRINEGMSIPKIAKELGISKSTVCSYVRDIVLTADQQRKLKHRDITGYKNSQKYREKRIDYQEQGKQSFINADSFTREAFIICTMLYWGEGSKSKIQMAITNSDVELLKLFLKSLRICFEINDNKIAFALNCYTDMHSVEEIKEYWINQLNIPNDKKIGLTLNTNPISSKNNKNGKNEWGTMRVTISDVRLVQAIYGITQEIGGFSSTKWLNGY